MLVTLVGPYGRSLHGGSMADLAADVDFANDRNPGCLDRNADIGELEPPRREARTGRTMPAPVAESFDKSLISP